MAGLIRIERNPTGRQLAFFGLLWAIFFGIVAFLVWSRTEAQTAAKVIGGMAVGVPLAGLVFRPILRWAWIVLTYAAFPIGWVISHVILAFVYYLVLTPIGLIMRFLVRRDPMHRRYDPEAESYWLPHDRPEAMERYFRQF